MLTHGKTINQQPILTTQVTLPTNPSQCPIRVNLKCDPDTALDLRDKYIAIEPGYHMNKRHWNTVILDDSIPRNLISEMIDQSLRLVVKTLNKADRERIEAKLPEGLT